MINKNEIDPDTIRKEGIQDQENNKFARKIVKTLRKEEKKLSQPVVQSSHIQGQALQTQKQNAVSISQTALPKNKNKILTSLVHEEDRSKKELQDLENEEEKIVEESEIGEHDVQIKSPVLGSAVAADGGQPSKKKWSAYRKLLIYYNVQKGPTAIQGSFQERQQQQIQTTNKAINNAKQSKRCAPIFVKDSEVQSSSQQNETVESLDTNRAPELPLISRPTQGMTTDAGLPKLSDKLDRTLKVYLGIRGIKQKKANNGSNENQEGSPQNVLAEIKQNYEALNVDTPCTNFSLGNETSQTITHKPYHHRQHSEMDSLLYHQGTFDDGERRKSLLNNDKASNIKTNRQNKDESSGGVVTLKGGCFNAKKSVQLPNINRNQIQLRQNQEIIGSGGQDERIQSSKSLYQACSQLANQPKPMIDYNVNSEFHNHSSVKHFQPNQQTLVSPTRKPQQQNQSSNLRLRRQQSLSNSTTNLVETPPSKPFKTPQTFDEEMVMHLQSHHKQIIGRTQRTRQNMSNSMEGGGGAENNIKVETNESLLMTPGIITKAGQRELQKLKSRTEDKQNKVPIKSNKAQNIERGNELRHSLSSQKQKGEDSQQMRRDSPILSSKGPYNKKKTPIVNDFLNFRGNPPSSFDYLQKQLFVVTERKDEAASTMDDEKSAFKNNRKGFQNLVMHHNNHHRSGTRGMSSQYSGSIMSKNNSDLDLGIYSQDMKQSNTTSHRIVNNQGGHSHDVQQERYMKVMNFNEEVMQCEFEKAERMLKRAEKLIKKAKQQAMSAVNQGQSVAVPELSRQQVKFALPQI